MVKSLFHSDKHLEELFAMWLDLYFYKRIQQHYKKVIRNTDTATQKLGVDVIIEKNNGIATHIDEKATLHYINKNIPTFAFEIMNMTSGAEGWLFNTSYITDTYLLAWPNALSDKVSKVEDFTSADIIIISRTAVHNLLAENGLTKDKIHKIMRKTISEPEPKEKLQVADGIALYFNNTLREKPVNIVIRKNTLKKYANYVCTVNKEKIIKTS